MQTSVLILLALAGITAICCLLWLLHFIRQRRDKERSVETESDETTWQEKTINRAVPAIPNILLNQYPSHYRRQAEGEKKWEQDEVFLHSLKVGAPENCITESDAKFLTQCRLKW